MVLHPSAGGRYNTRMPVKHHFNLRAFAIVVAPINFPMPPGGHLWKKMKPYCNPAALKEALLQDKRFVFEKELLDYEGDIVGYSFETKNMAQFRNAAKKNSWQRSWPDRNRDGILHRRAKNDASDIP